MKTRSVSLIALALAAFSVSAFADSNGQDVLKKIDDYQTAQNATLAGKSKSPDFRALVAKVDSNVKAMAQDELKKVTLQSVSPSDAYTWEQVAARAEDHAMVVAYAKRYLDSSPAPADAFKARSLALNSYQNLGDAKELEAQIELIKPADGEQSSELASNTIYGYSDLIDKKLGLEEALKCLDSLKGKLIPMDPDAYVKANFAEWRKALPAGKDPYKTDDDLKKAMIKNVDRQNDQMLTGIVSRKAELLQAHDKNAEALKTIDDFTAANKLSESAAKSLAKNRVQIALIGNPTPDFSAPGWDGKTTTLSGLKGKIVILDFWATWCGPCMHSLPHLEKVYEATKDKGVEVVALNVWDKKDAYDAWIPQHQAQYKFPFSFDPAGRGDASIATSKFGVSGIPTTVIIDQKGDVAATLVGFMGEDDHRLEKILEKLGVKI